MLISTNYTPIDSENCRNKTLYTLHKVVIGDHIRGTGALNEGLIFDRNNNYTKVYLCNIYIIHYYIILFVNYYIIFKNFGNSPKNSEFSCERLN